MIYHHNIFKHVSHFNTHSGAKLQIIFYNSLFA